MGRLGIVAGGGELPLIGINEAIRAGNNPLVFSIIESDFDTSYTDHIPFHVTRINSLFKLCKKHDVDKILMLGKVKKELIFKNVKFDLKTIGIMARAVTRNDYALFTSLADEFKKQKIEIISQKTYLQPLLLPEGRYTNKKIPSTVLSDIAMGIDYAEKMAAMDIGQSVVIKDKSVVAVEAVEGTDEAVIRGGQLTRNKGAVLCKSSRPGQDERFDLPTVGTHTLGIMKANGYSALAIRAGDTIVVNPAEFIRYADKAGIHFMVCGKSKVESINGKTAKTE